MESPAKAGYNNKALSLFAVLDAEFILWVLLPHLIINVHIYEIDHENREISDSRFQEHYGPHR